MVTSDLYNVSLTDDKLAILILGAKIIKKSLNDSRFKYTANFYPLETTGTCNCGVPAGKTALSMEKGCNHHGVSPQFLQPFSIDSEVFPAGTPQFQVPVVSKG